MSFDRRSKTPVVDGVLMSRSGDVHRDRGQITQCGNTLPQQRVAVSDLQAHVHKLPVCTVCYPPASGQNNRK